MIHQLDIYGRDKVQTAIERLQDYAKIFERQGRDEGFFVAFSGGKDSVVVKKLCDMAGVKYDAHYSVTTVDPPELVHFIQREYPDVIWERNRWETDGRFHKAGDIITMWNLIPEKRMPPTRLVRYCCQYLKECAGDGRLTVTGVRWAESANRKNNQGLVTVYKTKGKEEGLVESGNFSETPRGGVVLVNDNEEARQSLEFCYKRRKTVLNPIIDWEDDDIWEFIHEYNVPYCELYDRGYKRLGCIGCPMSTAAAEELEKYPKFKQAYTKAFDRMLIILREKGIKTNEMWKDGEGVMKWWIRQF